MSTIPGYDLENYLMWYFNIKVEGRSDANASLQIAEAIGTALEYRKVLSEDQFQKIVHLFEPYREDTEYWLLNFDEDYQSWRDYAGFSDMRFPKEILEKAKNLI